jgi:hypothetical protein
MAMNDGKSSFNRKILYVALFLVSSPVAFGAVVYRYEPATTVLVGKIEQQTFPGPPGFESIQQGDEPEKGWYLRLDQFINVKASKEDVDPNSEDESHVQILQLAFDPEKATGKTIALEAKRHSHVMLKGHLFHSLTGHHHSRVLLWVDEALEVKQ